MCHPDQAKQRMCHPDRPVVGGTDHVVDKLVGMIAIADRLNAASLVLISAAEPAPGLSDSQVIHVSEFDPNIDVAPGVPPVRIEQRLRPNYEQPPTLELNAPTLEPAKPVFSKRPGKVISLLAASPIRKTIATARRLAKEAAFLKLVASTPP